MSVCWRTGGTGVIGHWLPLIADCWRTGVLEDRGARMLRCWRTGVMGCWRIGVMGCWRTKVPGY